MQEVVDGTGAELYGLVLKEMDSVGCPSWLTRLAQSRANSDRFSIYAFVFDAGGECRSHLRRVGKDFEVAGGCENVAYGGIFCVQHQG